MEFHKNLEKMEGTPLTIELKNDLIIKGTLEAVDRFMNIKLLDIEVEDIDKHPQLLTTQNCFIRGSTIRYISFGRNDMNLNAIRDGCSKSAVEKTS